ncbi:MAG: lipoate--protein ligase family protein [Calditrichaeota bacterium]|jgi:lipoyl(octanoyl) transferase|nr:lipoate--protein ligase family protein [Calditrichota bacterium]MBT7789473.1 lipoate--protein ligase family protein [Calditrichota bacterium]
MTPPLNTRLIWDIPEKIENSHWGWFNMAADDFLADSIVDSNFQAILRFYTWSPPGISLGIHQNENAVDINACKRLGWDVVSRPTGGRTLLHDNDLSYSIILMSGGSSISQLRYLYKSVANALITTLSLFGIDGTDSQVATTRNLRNLAVQQAKLCASSCVRGEVTVNGVKISSAAQRVYRNSILQHGSVPLKGNIANVASVVNLPPDRKDNLKSLLNERAASLERFCEECPTPHDLAKSFAKSLEIEFNLSLSSRPWSNSELSLIHNRRTRFEKFSSAKKAS